MATTHKTIVTTTCDLCKNTKIYTNETEYRSNIRIATSNFTTKRYDDICKACSSAIEKFIKKELLKPKKK